ncbi:hypothetical protein BW731_10470 [Vagococcus martis]|uniref:Peptidase S9 prolyl oligopeptidase catalytic domain-containing protein n=1 Tax=Vagococcus martis TaxID=1768210 RepID=A0A1V4DJG9_9ENTE|nr:alpha/beta fold hydrolase [Vagococcus martis]OPF88562.1 hypothetical protein BW731_10470 [Vagococcus martis]
MKTITKERMIEHIPVLEVVPDNYQYDELPCIVFYHGWQTSKELALTPARKLAQLNNRVIVPDAMYHGSRRVENRSKIPSFAFWSSIQHNLIEFNLIKDYLYKKQFVLNNQLSVAGFSMGGMTSAGLLTKHPDITSAAILMGTPDYQGFIDRLVFHSNQRNIPLPPDLEDSLSWTKHYDLNTQPEKMADRPIYFWHGTKDEKIPYHASHDFFETYRHKPFGQQMVFDTGVDEPHILTIETMETMATFLDKHFTH